MSDWKNIVGTVAPALATALGGPLAGMAVKFVGDQLGLSNSTEETVAAAIQGATPDTLLKLKQADQDFATKMKSLEIDLERINSSDRDSARRMEVETKSVVPAGLAALVTLGFFGILLGLLAGILHTKDTPELLLLIGALATSWGAVMNYYFGSSSSSRVKDETIKSLSNG